MKAWVFFLPNGQQFIAHAFEADVPELHAGLGALAFGPAEKADEIEAALYGEPACPLCSVPHREPSVDLRLSNMDRPGQPSAPAGLPGAPSGGAGPMLIRAALRRCVTCTRSHFTTHRRTYAQGGVFTCLLVSIDAASGAGLVPQPFSWAVPVAVLLIQLNQD